MSKRPLRPASSSMVSHQSGAMLHRVASVSESRQPPAIVEQERRRTAALHFRVGEELALEIAARADAAGETQKQVIMRALAAAGFSVDQRDLEDRSPRRGFSPRRE